MIEPSQKMTSPVQWGTFFHQCLLHRIDANEFRNLSELLLQKCPIAETALLDALLQTRSESRIKWDPLLPLYIDCLCRTGRVRTSTVLTSLLKYSSIHDKPQLSTSEGKDGSKCYTLMTDIRVIQDTMLSVSTGSTPKTNAEAVAIFFAIIDWIHAVASWHNSHFDPGQHSSGIMSSPDVVSLFESLGILLAALSGTGKGLEVLSADSHEGIFPSLLNKSRLSSQTAGLKVKLGQALSAYLPLCVEVSLPLRNRLDGLQKEFNLYGERVPKSLDVPMMENMNVNALQFEASVMDGPVINSRAGLYVFINAMVGINLLASCTG